jgi:hypothetical protein
LIHFAFDKSGLDLVRMLAVYFSCLYLINFAFDTSGLDFD